MGEDVLDEGGEDVPDLFVADGSLLETDTVHEIDDIDKCVVLVGEGGGVGQQTEQLLQDLRAALVDVVDEVRVLPADAPDQLNSLEVEPINSANSMAFRLDSNMLLQCPQDPRLRHQPSHRCHVPALVRRQRFDIQQLVQAPEHVEGISPLVLDMLEQMLGGFELVFVASAQYGEYELKLVSFFLHLYHYTKRYQIAYNS